MGLRQLVRFVSVGRSPGGGGVFGAGGDDEGEESGHRKIEIPKIMVNVKSHKLFS